ncbi:MAG: XRE family transcriptional regulator, partial [Firmicutes bacterium]|nr:XRE family transcriptional regulator [Bacillota bacterium]
SPYAMSDPNFDTYVSVMHALFALEDQYGLHAYRDESGVPQLMFKDKGHDSLNMLDHIGAWADMYQKFRNEEIPEKEYLDWKSQFPAK